MLINILTSVVGAYIGLLFVRHMCRPCFIRALGRRKETWLALDSALSEQGWQIALLIRLSPASPMVATNVLLALTSISVPTYLWTTFGIIPANLPYAYAAVIGAELAHEFPPKDPVMLSMSLIGFVATCLIAWKVGSIATKILRSHGVGARAPTSAADDAAQPADVDGRESPPAGGRANGEGGDAERGSDGIELAVADGGGDGSDGHDGGGGDGHDGGSNGGGKARRESRSKTKYARGEGLVLGSGRKAKAFHELKEDPLL